MTVIRVGVSKKHSYSKNRGIPRKFVDWSSSKHTVCTQKKILLSLFFSLSQGLASGTLLFVVFFEILQEHHTGLRQYFSILFGFLVMFCLQMLSKYKRFYFVLTHSDVLHLLLIAHRNWNS